MLRTSSQSRWIFVALAAAMPACEEDEDCPVGFRECDSGCANFATDRRNCGFCRNACGDGQTCVVGECAACEAPNAICDDRCVDNQSDADHCGACDNACGSGVACVTGHCEVPLAALRTAASETPRDLYVVRDGSFDLAQINRTAFTSSRVIDHAVLPDGGVVYVAADETEGVFELFHAAPGGTVTKLNPPLVAGGEVLPGLALSADGAKLLYRAEQDVDGELDLYAVELAHPGEAVRVNPRPTLLGGTLAYEVSRVFALSADGTRATYIADQDVRGKNELYSVDLSTTEPGDAVQLNEELVTPVLDMKATADGARVVYRAIVNVNNDPQLFVVSLDAPGVVDAVTNPEGPEHHVEAYRFAPDEQALFYTGGTGFLNESLYRVSLASDSDFTSTSILDGGNNQFIRPDFAISPDGVFVYVRKAAFNNPALRVEIEVPGVATPIGAAEPGFDERVGDFALAPDGKSIVLRLGADGAEGGIGAGPGTDEPDLDRSRGTTLQFVDLSGATPGAPIDVTPPFASKAAQGIPTGYFVTNDDRVVYLADQETAERDEAWLVDVAAPQQATRISPPLDGDVTDVVAVTPF